MHSSGSCAAETTEAQDLCEIIEERSICERRFSTAVHTRLPYATGGLALMDDLVPDACASTLNFARLYGGRA